MATCERCGKEISDNVTICPSCGTVSSPAGPGSQPPPTYYGQHPGVYGDAANHEEHPYGGGYGQGYAPQEFREIPPQSSYRPHTPHIPYTPPLQPGYPPGQNYGYGPSSNTPPMYPPGAVNVTIVNNMSSPAKNNTPLLVEILLSIFLGIYGVGWLMAGDTTIGVVLLICSFVIYWPILAVSFFFTVFTLGLGLLCVAPFIIAAIILNAILLNNSLKRKAMNHP